MRDTGRVPQTRFCRKKFNPNLPVDTDSVALFRLGEQCNNACPMCSNSGQRMLSFHSTRELLKRADFLLDQGMRRVVVTGGEPTIHRGFWELASHLQKIGMAWDINTNGRSFARADFCHRALSFGLQRAIVSFHTHIPEVYTVISGVAEVGHRETISGIKNLVHAEVPLILNCVICSLNIDHLIGHVDFCCNAFGDSGYDMKFAFPLTTGKGRDWEPIQIRFKSVKNVLCQLKERFSKLRLGFLLEGIPPCVVGFEDVANMSRSGFGETHYLEDLSGNSLMPIEQIEAAMSVFPDFCRRCTALSSCPGIPNGYVYQYGLDEFQPMA